MPSYYRQANCCHQGGRANLTSMVVAAFTYFHILLHGVALSTAQAADEVVDANVASQSMYIDRVFA